VATADDARYESTSIRHGSDTADSGVETTLNVSEATIWPVEHLAHVLSEYAAALVSADGGELYIALATPDDVHIHLAGTCSGCPGATMTRERLLEPVVHSVLPRATVKVTTGLQVPEGAVHVNPA